MACFADINVLQGSVAIYVRCDGSCNIHLTTNLPMNFQFSVQIWQNCWPWDCGPTFWPTLYCVSLLILGSVFSVYNSANKHAVQPISLSRALPAAHVAWLNTQNCARFGSQISVICCELSGASPRTSRQGFCPWTPIGDFRPPDPLCLPTSKSHATVVSKRCWWLL